MHCDTPNVTKWHKYVTKKFSSSLSQTIVATAPTLEILSSQFNIPRLIEIPHVINLGANDTYDFKDCKITFKDAMHMIGSVQVAVEFPDGNSVGYSGDFSAEAINDPIDVDFLLVDSTYGHPDSVRSFTQNEANQILIDLIGDNYIKYPIYLKADMGTLQRTLSIINNTFPFLPILMTNKDKEIFDIYNKNGYAIDNIHIDNPLKQEIIEIKDEKKYIKFYRNKSVLPSDISNHISILLKCVYHRNSGPLTVHSDNSYTVAISDHADFNETIEYIKSVKPKLIYTDPSTNTKNASNLSKEITKLLGIKSKPAKIHSKYEWGK